MGEDLAEVIRRQHAELHDLLARLERQPAVHELTLQPQLRARDRLVRTIQRRFLACQAARLRYLWPALRAAEPDGRRYTDRAWQQTRAVEYRMAKRQWLGDRDETANELDDQIVWGIRKQLVLEERQLARIVEAARRGGRHGVPWARQLGNDGHWPTRPHPDVPRSPRLAVIVHRPLAISDRLLDRCSYPTE